MIMPSSIVPNLNAFFAHHWQCKPLLIRQAFPGFRPLLDARELIELAGQDEVESRLIQSSASRWRLEHGPFDPEQIPSLKKKHWTLLVQGVDLHLDQAHELLKQFRFIADARLDDLMISLAGDGGGVGPHFDSYDVFLLQAWGRREWRIGPLKDLSLRKNTPVKLLENFEPTESFVLEPGDMLYVPPNWGHDGVALGPCMTYSIGFRAPSRSEFLQAFFNDCSDRIDDQTSPQELYTDIGTRPESHPAFIPAKLTQKLEQWARAANPSKEDIKGFIGRYLSEPKDSVWFESPKRPLTIEKFFAKARVKGMRLHRASRLLLRVNNTGIGQAFFNGQEQSFAGDSLKYVSKLAETRFFVAPPQLERTEIGTYLYQAYTNGWIVLL
jgi:50S ribosomal protein L16 3-hydroxylase